MDPLTAFGLACNIITIVDFASKLVKAAFQINDSTSGLPEDHENMLNSTAELDKVLSSIQKTCSAAQSSQSSTVLDGELLELAGECGGLCDRLLKKLKGLQLNGNRAFSAQAFWHALKSLWKMRELEKLKEEIDALRSRIDQLRLHRYLQ
jgi:hypothetical protein